MSVASALASGNEPVPELAVEALRMALDEAGERQAHGVLLFLSAEFSRRAQQCVTAVARAAHCTQVVGGIAAGVFTASGWVVDRPAAAVMVLGGELSVGSAEGEPGDAAIFSYAGGAFPHGWAGQRRRRLGGCFSGRAGPAELLAWQQSRLCSEAAWVVRGARVDFATSTGWRFLAEACRIDSSCRHELLRVGGESALDNLAAARRASCATAAPPSLGEITTSLCAVLIDGACEPLPIAGAPLDGRQRTAAIIGGDGKGALTLSECPLPGQYVAWAIRSPGVAAADMRQSVARLAAAAVDPLAAVVFSCVGRGPFFYAGDDRDLDCLRQQFPRLPLIGTYGTGQIVPAAGGGGRLLQNAVLTTLLHH